MERELREMKAEGRAVADVGKRVEGHDEQITQMQRRYDELVEAHGRLAEGARGGRGAVGASVFASPSGSFAGSPGVEPAESDDSDEETMYDRMRKRTVLAILPLVFLVFSPAALTDADGDAARGTARPTVRCSGALRHPRGLPTPAPGPERLLRASPSPSCRAMDPHGSPPHPDDGSAGTEHRATKWRKGKPGQMDIRSWAGDRTATAHPTPVPRLRAPAAGQPRAAAAERYTPSATGEAAAAHAAAGSGAILPAPAAWGPSLSPALGYVAQAGQQPPAAAPTPAAAGPAAAGSAATPQQPHAAGEEWRELVRNEASRMATTPSGSTKTGVKKSWADSFGPCVHPPPTLPRCSSTGP